MLNATTRLIPTALASLALLAGSGCGDSKAPTAAGGASLPAGLVVTEAAPSAKGVLEVRPTAKVGEQVSVLGRIGGSRSPFVSNLAIFTIVDPSLHSCVEMGDDDHCPRPWDYCCEEKSSLGKAIASIQVTGADGKALPLALAEEGSLKPLMLVAVDGTVESVDGGSMVVRAQKIRRIPGDPLAAHVK